MIPGPALVASLGRICPPPSLGTLMIVSEPCIPGPSPGRDNIAGFLNCGSPDRGGNLFPTTTLIANFIGDISQWWQIKFILPPVQKKRALICFKKSCLKINYQQKNNAGPIHFVSNILLGHSVFSNPNFSLTSQGKCNVKEHQKELIKHLSPWFELGNQPFGYTLLRIRHVPIQPNKKLILSVIIRFTCKSDKVSLLSIGWSLELNPWPKKANWHSNLVLNFFSEVSIGTCR